MQMCEGYEARISALIDDELTAAERIEVLDHISRCPGCRAYWEELLALRDVLRSETAAPAGFADGVMARVHVTAQEKSAAEKKIIRFPGAKRLAAMAACCAVVLLGVWTAGNFSMENTADQVSVRNSAAPESYAAGDMDMGGAANGSAAEDTTCAEAPTAEAPSAEADDAAYGVLMDAPTLITASPVAGRWVEDALGMTWISGATYELTEEQYNELRGLLTEQGETFNEITGDNTTGSYWLRAE